MISLLIISLISVIVAFVMPNKQFHSIAHRGASFFEPEESLNAYLLAIEHGVDFLECDIVSTKDEVLILRHSPNLSESTNIDDLEEFKSYRTTVPMYDSDEKIEYVNGIFSWDLTYDQIKKLSCRHEQRFSDRDSNLNDKYPILTFDELLDLIYPIYLPKDGTGLRIGLYVEIKFASYHQQRGLGNITDKLLDKLAERGLKDSKDKIYIQSFEPDNLKYIRSKSDLNLVQLITSTSNNLFACAYQDDTTDGKMKLGKCNLDQIISICQVVSPYKESLIETSTNKQELNEFLHKIRNSNILLVPYTFRPESILNQFETIEIELDYYYSIVKVNGFFCDDTFNMMKFINSRKSSILY